MRYSTTFFLLLSSAYAFPCDRNSIQTYITNGDQITLSIHVSNCTRGPMFRVDPLIEYAAQLGNVEAIKTLSLLGGDRTLMTALSYCRKNGLLTEAREILNHADFFSNATEVISKLALEFYDDPEFLDLLVEFGANIEFKSRKRDRGYETTLINTAIEDEQPGMFSRVLEDGANINYSVVVEGPLAYAVKNNQV